MFTGIVETIGTVESIEELGDLTRLTVEAPDIVEGVSIGDSVSINGGCLTVTSSRGGSLSFDAIQETLDRTALGDLAVGSRVNLERAMRASDRLDGHIVQGHVDGVGRVTSLRREGHDVRLEIACERDFAETLVQKGSVAIDGVSLTVASIGTDGFDVALIPHTLEVTTLSERQTDDRVNLEADVLGKYVKQYLERILPANVSAAG